MLAKTNEQINPKVTNDLLFIPLFLLKVFETKRKVA
jgi:hypothetical protein